MRNPSTGAYVFRSFNQYGIGDRQRAETARRANLILAAMVGRLTAKGVVLQLADVEKALFMVGYDVR
jgi:hypothetical protein